MILGAEFEFARRWDANHIEEIGRHDSGLDTFCCIVSEQQEHHGDDFVGAHPAALLFDANDLGVVSRQPDRVHATRDDSTVLGPREDLRLWTDDFNNIVQILK